MIWTVYYTDEAQQDLQDVYDYISNGLLEPVIAKKQVNKILDAVDSLDNMPMRYRLYEQEPWHSKGLRVLPVESYLVFYLAVETKNTVVIIRIMYGGRDIKRQLTEPE